MSAAILWTLNLPLGLPLGHIAFLSFRDRSKTRIKTALCYANGSWQTCVIVALTTVNFGYVRQDRPKMSMPGWEDCLAAQARAPAGGAVPIKDRPTGVAGGEAWCEVAPEMAKAASGG